MNHGLVNLIYIKNTHEFTIIRVKIPATFQGGPGVVSTKKQVATIPYLGYI